MKNGIDFLVFKFYIRNNRIVVKVRNQTKKKFKRKMKTLDKLYDNGLISAEERVAVVNSYIGHLSYGDCGNLVFKSSYCKKILILEMR